MTPLTQRLLYIFLFLLFGTNISAADVSISQLQIIDFGDIIPSHKKGHILLGDSGPQFTSGIIGVEGQSQGKFRCDFTEDTQEASIWPTSIKTEIYHLSDPTQTMQVVPIANHSYYRSCCTYSKIRAIKSILYIGENQMYGPYKGYFEATIKTKFGEKGTYKGLIQANILPTAGITSIIPLKLGTFTSHAEKIGKLIIHHVNGSVEQEVQHVIEAPSRGEFTLKGEVGSEFSYRFTPHILTLTHQTHTLTAEMDAGGKLQFNEFGNGSVYVGAHMKIPPKQVEGTYSGVFHFVVDF